MRPRTRVHALAAVLGAVLALAACSGGSGGTNASVPAPTTVKGLTVLALGGSATEGDGVPDRLRDAWPYLVFHASFPDSTVFVNGALDGATARRAVALQAPLAAELKPDVVEVWIGADDVLAATPAPEFSAAFTELIETLFDAGSGRVLVADLPPAYGSAAGPYNLVIRGVVAQTHAELVPLDHVAVTLAPTDGLAPQPDAASQRAVAAAFERQIAGGG